MRRSILLLAAICVHLPAAAVAAASLQVGVARVDLTPPLEMKAALGGYGARMSKPATGVHDRVWAKALMLRQGTQRRVIITADALGFPPGLREAVAGALAAEGWRADAGWSDLGRDAIGCPPASGARGNVITMCCASVPDGRSLPGLLGVTRPLPSRRMSASW